MSTGKVVLGVLAGVAAGAALGILFAPDKGAATRKKLCKKGEGYTGEIGDKFNEFIESITQKFEAAKEEAIRHMAEKGKEKVDEAEAAVKAATI